jgi:hypothetical protein
MAIWCCSQRNAGCAKGVGERTPAEASVSATGVAGSGRPAFPGRALPGSVCARFAAVRALLLPAPRSAHPTRPPAIVGHAPRPRDTDASRPQAAQTGDYPGLLSRRRRAGGPHPRPQRRPRGAAATGSGGHGERRPRGAEAAGVTVSCPPCRLHRWADRGSAGTRRNRAALWAGPEDGWSVSPSPPRIGRQRSLSTDEASLVTPEEIDSSLVGMWLLLVRLTPTEKGRRLSPRCTELATLETLFIARSLNRSAACAGASGLPPWKPCTESCPCNAQRRRPVCVESGLGRRGTASTLVAEAMAGSRPQDHAVLLS